MQNKLDVLEKRGVWIVVSDEGQYCHDFKRVHKRKYTDDHPIKWRSRLCLRGFKRKITEDYFETFSPVLRKESLRLFFALMSWLDFQCDQTDVDSAFPYADLEKVIHIKPPVGVRIPPGCVLRLKKELYGLKQAPRAWYQLVTSVLIDFGFTKCVSYLCIFFFRRGKDMVMVGVYVDDILIIGNNRALINKVKGYIEYHFKIKTMGLVRIMLGMNHNVLDGLLTMDQSKMIKKIVEEFQLYNNALINSPLGKKLKVRDVETTPMIPGQVLSS
jgi:Reverse transcriptase (RNA-dependent DNA polymerase)